MEDNKINTFLLNRGIDPSVPLLNLEEEVLGDIKQHDIFTETSFDMLRIKNQIRGQKKEMMMRNCIVENVNVRALTISGKCTFYNCTFNNVVFTTCSLPNCCFYHCTFKDCAIVESTLSSVLFVNCNGLEEVDFKNNNFSNMKVIGSNLDAATLEDQGNKVEGAYIREELFITGVEEKVEEHKEVEITTRQTVEKITYKNESFGLKELKNILFSECIFISCEFDKNMQLDASTDFINCTFKNMALDMVMFQKVIFDYSTFEDVFMSSRFLHCSFVGCQFKSLSFSDDVAFTSCNFALSNAFEVFDMNKHHMTNIELNRKEVEEDEQLNILLDALYTLLKDRDKELQRSLRLLDRDAVTKDIMADYLMNLNDRQYIEFISEVGTRRRDEEDE